MTLKKPPIDFDFAYALLTWFDTHGRKDLPWQQDKSPYRVWLSEIMLQQTQVVTAIPYFQAFIAKFPTVESLAAAPLDDVLLSWAGLGYYARARNLHHAAKTIVQLGYFPNTLPELLALSGIGKSTAGAILSIAFQKSQPILDGNVKRVLTRFYTISGWTGLREIENKLWELSEKITPSKRCDDYTQAIMDLGATLCTRRNPRCEDCPLSKACVAFSTQSVATYPSPKVTKKSPVKQTLFLVLRNEQGQLWLEQRPVKGIWGGLWSLPEVETIEHAQAWCEELHLTIQSQRFLPTARHTFSHFHLDFTPCLFEITATTDEHWHSPQNWQIRALPAPISTLLKQLMTEEFL